MDIYTYIDKYCKLGKTYMYLVRQNNVSTNKKNKMTWIVGSQKGETFVIKMMSIP